MKKKICPSERASERVLLCFIRTDVECCIGYRGFPQESPHPFFAHPRRELRLAPLFLTDHCRVPGTTIRGSQWGPASAWSHKGVMPSRQEIPSEKKIV